MADKWYVFAVLRDRAQLKALILRHGENLANAGREIGCSAHSVKTALEKHMILLTKERESATREEMRIKRFLHSEEI